MVPQQRQINQSGSPPNTSTIASSNNATPAIIVLNRYTTNGVGKNIEGNDGKSRSRSTSAESNANMTVPTNTSNNPNSNVKRKGRFNIVHPPPPRSRSSSASNSNLLIHTPPPTAAATINATVKSTSVAPDFSSTSGSTSAPIAPGSPDSNSANSNNSASIVMPSSSSLTNDNMLANASSINIPPSIPFTDESKLNPPKSMPSTVKAKKKGRFLLTSAKGPSEQTTSGTQSNQDLKSLQRQHQVLISPAQSIEDPDSGANHQIAQSSSLSALNCKDNFTSSSISSLTQPLHPPPNPAQAISVFYNLPDTMNTNGDSGKNGHLGMGKLFQLCDQMKNEMIETDKTLLNLQNELSLLRAKNAELEIKNLEMNKIYLEEKRLKEYAEANFEQLKKLVEKDHINLIQHHERNKEPVPTFTGTSQKETREHIKKKFQTFDLSTNPNHVQNSANNHSQHGHSHIQTAATIKNDYQDLEKMQKHNEQSNPTYMNATLHPLVQKLYFSNASSTSVHTLTPTPIPTPPKVSSALKHQYSSSSNTTLSGAISCNGVIETLSQHPSSTQIESKRQEQGQVQIHSSTIQESKKFHVKEIKCDKNSKSTQSNQRNSNGILFSRNEAKTKIRQFKTRNPSPASIQS